MSGLQGQFGTHQELESVLRGQLGTRQELESVLQGQLGTHQELESVLQDQLETQEFELEPQYQFETLPFEFRTLPFESRNFQFASEPQDLFRHFGSQELELGLRDQFHHFYPLLHRSFESPFVTQEFELEPQSRFPLEKKFPPCFGYSPL